MTTYHYDDVIVWQLGPQGYVRGAEGAKSEPLTDSTGAPVLVTQDGQTRTYLIASDEGRCTFTAEVPSLTAQFGGAVMTLYSQEAAGATGDPLAAYALAQSADTRSTTNAATLATLQPQVDANTTRLATIPTGVLDLTKSRPALIGQVGIPSGQVMQSATFDPISRFWFVASPTGSSPETLRVHRLTTDGDLVDTMTLTGAGHGYQIGVQTIAGVPNLWLTWQQPPSGSVNSYSLVSFPYVGGVTITRDDPSITVHPTMEAAGKFVIVAHDWANGYSASRIGGDLITYTRRRTSDMEAGIDDVVGVVGGIPNTSRQYQGHATLGDRLYVLTGMSTDDKQVWIYDWNTGSLLSSVHINDLGLNPDGSSPGPCEPEGINAITDPVTGLSSLVVGIAAGNAPRANLLYQYSPPGQADMAGAMVITQQISGLEAQQTQLMSVAATIDELSFTFTASSNAENPVWAAPFPCQVVACTAVFSAGIAASDTTYEVVTLAKRPASAPATPATIVTKTSQATGGEGVTAWKAWDFAGATWDPAAQTFATGDVLTVAIPNVGTPNLGSARLTIRYVPASA